MSFRIFALVGLTLAGTIVPHLNAPAYASPASVSMPESTPESTPALTPTSTQLLASAAASSETSNAPTTAPTMIAARSDDRTIVVAVSDSSSIPVEQVQMKYSVYDSGYYDYDTSLFVEPQQLPTEEIEAAMIAALSRAGISADNVDLNYTEVGMYGGGEVTAIVTLPASHTAIGNATQAVMSLSSQFTELTVQTVGIRLGSSRCDALAGEARLKTIEQARERAAILAEAIGVTLGDVMHVYESYQDLIPYAAATCLEESGDFPPVRLSSYGGEWTMYIENAPLEIELSTTLEVTFSAD